MSDEKVFPIIINATPRTAVNTASSAVSVGISYSRTTDWQLSIPPMPIKFSVPSSENLNDAKLIILKYEIEMYLAARWTLQFVPDSHLRYALVESAVLHARSLCDFFCNRKSGKYLTLGDLEDINKSPYPTLISDLKNAYNGQGKVRPREAFNEFVAHMTKKREKHARGYDYYPELSAIEQSLERMIEQIKPLFLPKLELTF